jgi:hypothetical protein
MALEKRLPGNRSCLAANLKLSVLSVNFDYARIGVAARYFTCDPRLFSLLPPAKSTDGDPADRSSSPIVSAQNLKITFILGIDWSTRLHIFENKCDDEPE